MSVRAEAAAKSAEVRRRRLRKLGIRLGVFVGLPTLLAILHYGVIAAPQYYSVAVVAVQSAPAAGGQSGALDAVLPPSTAREDGHIVREYMLSREMVQHLAERYRLVELYAGAGDWLSRLDPDAPFEEVYSYYRDRVDVTYRSASRTMTVRVRAFSPQAAQSLAGGILTQAQTVLDRLAQDPGSAPAQARTRMISISHPSLPDAPGYPRRLWGIATVFFVALALAIVIGLFTGAVREHAKL